MYPRVVLDPAEEVVFSAPAFIGGSGGHVFVTDRRVITLPIRSFTRPRARTLMATDLAVSDVSKGIGWPMSKRRLELAAGGSVLRLRPWSGQGPAGVRLDSFMGMISADAFFNGMSDALISAGVRVQTND